MLSGLFKFPSDDFSPGHELCAGHQLYENNIHHLKDKNQQESELQAIGIRAESFSKGYKLMNIR